MTPTGSGDKVVWEAMACGRPCLAANEGFRETMGEYAEKLLFRYGDEHDLARKLQWLLCLDLTQRIKVEDTLKNRVQEFHSLNSLVNKLLLILEGNEHEFE
jgi:glycosyltransferase involved in cell wall biosynthesis